jgi:hypothetical protein
VPADPGWRRARRLPHLKESFIPWLSGQLLPPSPSLDNYDQLAQRWIAVRVIAVAYARRSLAIASHWPFDQWGRFLPDETTAVSMIDRILHHAVVVVTEGESFRMKEAKTRGGGPQKRKG